MRYQTLRRNSFPLSLFNGPREILWYPTNLSLQFRTEIFSLFSLHILWYRCLHAISKLSRPLARQSYLSLSLVFRRPGRLGSHLRRESAKYSRLVSGASKPAPLVEYQKDRDFRQPDLVCQLPLKLSEDREENAFFQAPNLLQTIFSSRRCSLVSSAEAHSD
jgi:hypothetical protein